MDFIIYNKSGEILRVGSCPSSMASLQIDETGDELMMEGVADDLTMYIKDNQVVSKTDIMLNDELLQYRIKNPRIALKKLSIDMTSEEVDIALNKHFMNKVDIFMWRKTHYEILRSFFYPDIAIYVDAIVKQHSSNATLKTEGEVQQQLYIDKCLTIKQVYEKLNKKEK